MDLSRIPRGRAALRAARLGPASLAALAAGLVLAGCGGPAAPPDIVLITIDTIRADRLGCYGYWRDTSPAIDRLASESVVFENAVTHCATTLPAHVSLMTATNLSTHGIRGNFFAFERSLETGSGLTTIAELLRDRGYDTAGFVSAAPVKRRTGMAGGFTTWDEPPSIERKAGETIDLALAWLAAPREAPVFLWVHLFDPHNTYEPPPPFDSMFPVDDAALAYLRDHAYTLWEDPTVQRFNGLYDGEIRYCDEQLGRLFDFLRERDGLTNTAIAIAGDHGEGMGQHDWITHDRMHEEQLRVPMILRFPGGLVAPGRHPGLVGLVDLVPTLLAPLRVPLSEDARIDGRDALAGPERAWVVSERARGLRAVDEEQYVLTGLDWKYLHNTTGPDELYHLASDPYETENVLAERPEVAERLLAELLPHVLAEPGSESAPTPLDEEHLEQLRALGYTD